MTDLKPISFKQIPKELLDYYSIPALSQSLNISIKYPNINWYKVENYFTNNTFNSYDDLVQKITNEFSTTLDKLYAAYYFTTHHIKYDKERSYLKVKNEIAVETLFKIKKGVCCDYSKFFIQLAKQIGITSKMMKLHDLSNCPKQKSFNSYHPPSSPKFTHSNVFIEYKGQEYVCDPTWGAGYTDDNDKFIFHYDKSYFLIPFSKALLIYYPEDFSISSIPYSFTYEQFTSLNKPELERELSFESNPSQVIHVKNGQYEFHFSHIQPCGKLHSLIYHLRGNTWYQQGNNFVYFYCIDKDVPNHCYSLFPDKKRCRYKMSISFPKAGPWKLEVFIDSKLFFNVYFEVENGNESLKGIPGHEKEENGFIPISPVEGLSTVDNGRAQIRFAIKLKRSLLLVNLYEIQKGTFTRKSNDPYKDCDTFVTLDLPFNFTSNNDDPNERLVEDWLWIDFPKNGRWEVYIYFKNDGKDFSYGVNYYFDVSGTKSSLEYPIYSLHKKRTFAPFLPRCQSFFQVEPSFSTIILNDEYDFYFTVFSDKKPNINFVCKSDPNGKTIFPDLIYEKDTNRRNIKERKYSISVRKSGYYELKYFEGDYIGYQKYFIINGHLSKESSNDKSLMINLQKQISGTIDYNKDIAGNIKSHVKRMLSFEEDAVDENESDAIKTEIEEKNQKKKHHHHHKHRKNKEISLEKKVELQIEKFDEIEITVENEEKEKLIDKIRLLENEKESFDKKMKEKDIKEKQMREELKRSEQKILELNKKIEKMEKSQNHNDKIVHQNQKEKNIKADNIKNKPTLSKKEMIRKNKLERTENENEYDYYDEYEYDDIKITPFLKKMLIRGSFQQNKFITFKGIRPIPKVLNKNQGQRKAIMIKISDEED